MIVYFSIWHARKVKTNPEYLFLPLLHFLVKIEPRLWQQQTTAAATLRSSFPFPYLHSRVLLTSGNKNIVSALFRVSLVIQAFPSCKFSVRIFRILPDLVNVYKQDKRNSENSRLRLYEGLIGKSTRLNTIWASLVLGGGLLEAIKQKTNQNQSEWKIM